MKRSAKLRYVSMGSFIIGYVGLSYYVDPIMLLFIWMAMFGFLTTKDVIRLEESEQQLEAHQLLADTAIEEMKKFEKEFMKRKENANPDDRTV